MNAVLVAMTVTCMPFVLTPLDHLTAVARRDPLGTDAIVHVLLFILHLKSVVVVVVSAVVVLLLLLLQPIGFVNALNIFWCVTCRRTKSLLTVWA